MSFNAEGRGAQSGGFMGARAQRRKGRFLLIMGVACVSGVGLSAIQGRLIKAYVSRSRYGVMAKVRVMYWKEIPVQVQAQDEGGMPVSVALDARFQQGVDAVSMFDGSGGSDDYLMAWEWVDYGEVEGAAADAAAAVAACFNADFPRDFVARIRDMQRAGTRDARPGAVDHWLDGGDG